MDTQLNAGRELDALVAEKVMGWRRVDDHLWEDADRRLRSTAPWSSWAFHPSTDVAAAWQVVEKIQGFDTDRDEPWWSVALFYAQPGQVMCRVYACQPGRHIDDTQQSIAESIADTAPLAICRAALAAVERAS